MKLKIVKKPPPQKGVAAELRKLKPGHALEWTCDTEGQTKNARQYMSQLARGLKYNYTTAINGKVVTLWRLDEK